MSKLVFISSLGMLAYFMVMPYVMISGNLVAGIWEPAGSTAFWAILVVVRWIPSAAQIEMSKKEGTKKKKKMKKTVKKRSSVGSTSVDTENEVQFAAASSASIADSTVMSRTSHSALSKGSGSNNGTMATPTSHSTLSMAGTTKTTSDLDRFPTVSGTQCTSTSSPSVSSDTKKACVDPSPSDGSESSTEASASDDDGQLGSKP